MEVKSFYPHNEVADLVINEDKETRELVVVKNDPRLVKITDRRLSTDSGSGP